MATALSQNGVAVRLTDERWRHIEENHDEVAGYYDEVLETVEEPQWILRGYGGALVAVRAFGSQRYLAVIYKEVSAEDGFVVTAYFTSRINRKAIVWPRRR